MTRANQKSRTLNIILWVVQALLALTFIWAGTMKLFRPTELPWLWVKEHPALVNISAIFDVLVGVGLILPSLLRIQPKLTIYAAYGTITLMITASIFHILRGETSQISFNVFILISAIFIAWGRQNKSPIKNIAA